MIQLPLFKISPNIDHEDLKHYYLPIFGPNNFFTESLDDFSSQKCFLLERVRAFRSNANCKLLLILESCLYR